MTDIGLVVPAFDVATSSAAAVVQPLTLNTVIARREQLPIVAVMSCAPAMVMLRVRLLRNTYSVAPVAAGIAASKTHVFAAPAFALLSAHEPAKPPVTFPPTIANTVSPIAASAVHPVLVIVVPVVLAVAVVCA